MPIITVPIVSKAIGPQGIGTYNYTNSIAQYFILAAGLGVGLYGNREISLAWNRKENVSKVFWEIFTFKAVLTIISTILYLILVTFFQNRVYFYIQAFAVISVFFDISWFFMGIEDFKKTSLASLITQVIAFILIVNFVKDSSDTMNYIIIQTVNILLPQMIVWFFLKPYIDFEKVSISQSFKHIFGSFAFFIPQVAILLYTNLNKTIIGVFLGEKSVGYYSNAMMLNFVFITIITTLDTVLLPHMSGLFAKNNVKKIVETMVSTIHLQLFFSIPIMFGMLTVYDKLIPWFFGTKFLIINDIVPIFSVLVVINPLGTAISRQYLLPIGKTKEYNVSVLTGALINIAGNLLLLPHIGLNGVVISFVLAEFFVTFVRTRSFLKVTSFKFDLRKIIIYFFTGLFMCVLTRWITRGMSASIGTNVLQAIVAVVIYFTITTIMKVNPLCLLNKRNRRNKK